MSLLCKWSLKSSFQTSFSFSYGNSGASNFPIPPFWVAVSGGIVKIILLTWWTSKHSSKPSLNIASAKKFFYLKGAGGSMTYWNSCFSPNRWGKCFEETRPRLWCGMLGTFRPFISPSGIQFFKNDQLEGRTLFTPGSLSSPKAWSKEKSVEVH